MATQENVLNTSNSTNRVVAFFDDREKAYQAMSRLKDAGFSTQQIGLAVGDEYEGFGTRGTSERERATHGTSFWQKVKDFFSGEDHDSDTDFQNAGSDMGWDEQRYRYYEQGISSGGAIVSVTGDRVTEARKILEQSGGDLRESGFAQNNTARASTSMTGVRDQSNRPDVEGERRIQLRGEILRTYKDRVQRGEVRLRKEVVTQTQSVNVPVSREELVIERTPGTGPATGKIGADEEIRVPLSEERVRTEKQPVVNEEVRVGKRNVQTNEQVSDQVRHEELRVDKEGQVDTESGKRSKKPAA